jgi:tetratricopeptide (TPR) repeat protein
MKRLPKSSSHAPTIAGYLFLAIGKHFPPSVRPQALCFLKDNFANLAHHYHALYQDPEQVKAKAENFREALGWYEEFLVSFPRDAASPAMNYRLADLLLENGNLARAALEYEKTAYGYPSHERSAAAGYAAVCAYREQLGAAAPEEKDQVQREMVRSSLTFAELYQQHGEAASVLAAAADDLYGMKHYDEALAAARKLIESFPDAEPELLKSAWILAGRCCYDLKRYAEAEAAYAKVLALLPSEESRAGFVDNLAASIRELGEQAKAVKDYPAAANHFLRVRRMASTLKLRLLAIGLLLLAGCATGGNAKKAPVDRTAVLAATPPPLSAGPSVTRFKDGRDGFLITESSSRDAELRGEFNDAVAMIREARYEKAVALLDKVIARAPAMTAPHINIAIAYDHLNQPEQAEKHLKTALELLPGHPVASNEYGLLLRKAGRFAEARTTYEKSLAAFPEYHPIERNLAILCDIYLKDLACAAEHYQSYSKAMPGDKQVKLWLADLQSRSGQVALQTGAGH